MPPGPAKRERLDRRGSVSMSGGRGAAAVRVGLMVVGRGFGRGRSCATCDVPVRRLFPRPIQYCSGVVMPSPTRVFLPWP